MHNSLRISFKFVHFRIMTTLCLGARLYPWGTPVGTKLGCARCVIDDVPRAAVESSFMKPSPLQDPRESVGLQPTLYSAVHVP